MPPAGPITLELELPVGEHRERLLDALARLIRLRGFETFVGAPLLLPDALERYQAALPRPEPSSTPDGLDDPGSYRRFGAVLDRRFEEWRAAAGGKPEHAI